VINLGASYIPFQNTLQVFVGGVYQVSTTVDPVNGAYTETNGSTITFTGEQLVDGEIVIAVIGNILTNVAVGKATYTTAGANETVITVGGGLEYVVGTNTLDVYVDGVYQDVDLHYTETSPTSITFTTPIVSAGAVASFKIG